MKKIYILLVLLAGWSLAGCEKYLNRSPEDSINDASYWQSIDHLRNYINQFYNYDDLLPQYGGGAGPFMSDNGSDIQVPTGISTRMNGAFALSQASGWDWGRLRQINYFMANYQRVTNPQANRYVGEALVFRAIFYFNMIQRFGDVPWYDQLLETTSEGLYNARDSRAVVVQHLMDDLDKAVEYLPVKTSAGGRLNKETAMLLQARIALYEGTWEKYHAAKNTAFKVEGKNGQNFIQKAADVTNALIALNTCAIETTGADAYQKVFNRVDYTASKEVLFWRKYSLTDNIRNMRTAYSWTGAGTGATKSLIDAYLCTDGKPIESSSNYMGDATLMDVVTNRDPRLLQTIYINDGAHFTSKTTLFTYPMLMGAATEETNTTGYQIYKGHDPALADRSLQGEQGTIYFRYAEALLINAEAKAELGSITQTDLDNTINKLRNRAGIPHMIKAEVDGWAYTKEFPSLSNIINEIRRERKVELCFEGFRTGDIFRWAAADELVKGQRPLGAKRAQWEGTVENITNFQVDAGGYIDYYKTTGALTDAGYGFNVNRDYLLPIPLQQITLNPKLVQNPGGW